MASRISRRLLVIAHDVVATAAALVATFYFRFETAGLEERWKFLLVFAPVFAAYAAVIYRVFHLYRSKWRFASLPDLFNIVKAVSVLSVTLVLLDYVLVSADFYGTYFFGKITIVLYFLLQILFLGGPRISYRYLRYARARPGSRSAGHMPTLIVGRLSEAEALLRLIETGIVSNIRPVGILSPLERERDQSVRGVAVLGGAHDIARAVADLEERNARVTRLVLTPSALAPEARPEAILVTARRLGLTTSRVSSFDNEGPQPQLAAIDIEDLLLRPSVETDYQRVEAFTRGKAIVVTGGGGSIGSEICRRVATFGARKLLVIENSEPALYAILEQLAAQPFDTEIEGRIADIRDRDRIFRLLRAFKPDIVFHAAALKHVPILERDWCEGVKTNVTGTVNVADATVASGAGIMVLISTDKAVEPVSVLGATKRFAEMYCQSLDAELAAAGRTERLIAVRFGNVLASNGSVVPKFKAQIEAGGPVTVTHPDMVRYFMTIREACDLVVTAGSHAVGSERSDTAVYVLNMGQAVKISELAERMIRLVGLEPGRDIEIAYSGIRPGERLHEILFADKEPTTTIGIAGIVAARPLRPSRAFMAAALLKLEAGVAAEDQAAVEAVLQGVLAGAEIAA